MLPEGKHPAVKGPPESPHPGIDRQRVKPLGQKSVESDGDVELEIIPAFERVPDRTHQTGKFPLVVGRGKVNGGRRRKDHRLKKGAVETGRKKESARRGVIGDHLAAIAKVGGNGRSREESSGGLPELSHLEGEKKDDPGGERGKCRVGVGEFIFAVRLAGQKPGQEGVGLPGQGGREGVPLPFPPESGSPSGVLPHPGHRDRDIAPARRPFPVDMDERKIRPSLPETKKE
jgi:hypothetical protein